MSNPAYKKLYASARWRRLRQSVLDDQPLCEMCSAAGIVTPANVVDHKRPHQGDEELFWDRENLQALCAPHHDIHKQRQEVAAGYHGAFQYRPEWLEPSKVPLVIVCGPPAGGKSIYVQENAARGDMVIDLDVIASGLSGHPIHGWDRAKWLGLAIRHRNNMLGSLSRSPRCKRAWLILSEAAPDKRQWWVDKMEPESVVVLETPAAVCMERVRADASRTRDVTFEAIGKWWSSYGRRDGDIVLRP